MNNSENSGLRKIFCFFLKILPLFALFSYSIQISAQNEVVIKGKIIDNYGVPIIGSNIIEKGTLNGTVTNIDGLYTIKLNTTPAILVFSFVGYLSQEMTVDGQKEINITLIEDILSLDELVVIGYGTVKKGDVTGAITVVNTKDLKSSPAVGALGALQGKASGVRVVSNSGQPGTEPTVWVRGLNSVSANTNPLYIVDGTPVNSINFLNPSDIASIDILKDASSAAIYGSRASSGVVLITTKRGSNNAEFSNNISFDAYFGSVQAIKAPVLLTAPQEYQVNLIEDLDAGIKNSKYSNIDSLVNLVEQRTGSKNGTNWWNEAINKQAMVKNYSLSVDGGNKTMAYSASMNYMNQDGILKTSNYNKYSFKLNTDINLSKRIKLSSNLIFSEEKRNALGESNNSTPGILRNIFQTSAAGPVFRDPENPMDSEIMNGYWKKRVY